MRAITTLLLYAALILTLPVAWAESDEAVRINYEANRSYYAGQHELALKKFNLAKDAAQKAGDTQYEAIAMYGLARTNVKLCNLVEADRWYRTSIEARDKLPDDKYARITQNLVEYARFLIATGKPLEAIPLIERAIPKLEDLDIQHSDPIAYAELIDDYVSALKKTGRDDKDASAKSKKLRDDNPGKLAKFKAESLPANCLSKQ